VPLLLLELCQGCCRRLLLPLLAGCTCSTQGGQLWELLLHLASVLLCDMNTTQCRVVGNGMDVHVYM
jgi:hypothetical protein